MNRRLTPLLVAAVLCTSSIAPSATGADAMVSGSWSVHLKSQYRARDTTMDLVQKGTALTGHIVDSGGKRVPLAGSVEGTLIAFSYELTGIQVNGMAQPMLRFTGTVKGNTITAKADQPVVGVIEMKASRN